MSTTVPQPRLRPILGNLPEMDKMRPVQSLMRLAQEYGPFFKLQVVNRYMYIASSHELVNELCDETRFNKKIHLPLEELRALGGDGLFTAHNEEPNWAKAHRLLMPAFGPGSIRAMFPGMLDIADQMFTRWERFGPDHPIDVADAMTRLTLDTIALCAFNYRFNSFYREEMHPFVGAMVSALTEAGQRSRRLPLFNKLMRSRTRRYHADLELLRQVAQDLIAERRRDPHAEEKKDLLNIMLNGVDPVTDEKLSDENIGYQMVTFLIAGHETTSGLLSFATYLLLKNPHVLEKARAMVDEVLGDEMPRVEHLSQLPYLEQILLESLRIWPTAPAFGVKPVVDTVLAGKYPVAAGDTILILTPTLHRDPRVWGDDPEAFVPERFAPGNVEKLPPNCWKPFGNGMRSCIGRPFAMQEAHLVLAMMLQRFDIEFDDPNYKLRIQETLTLKPDNLRIRAKARRASSRLIRVPVQTAAAASSAQETGSSQAVAENAVDLLVLFGSNAGSAETFARRLAAEAAAHGFRPTVDAMDAYAGRLPTSGALIVVTASYEGQPPDNARQFVSYVEGLKPGDLDGLKFAVFGCGNRQWTRTYQAIPKRVDAALAAAGAERVAERGEADANGDFFGMFDAWESGLWPQFEQAFGRAPAEAAGTRTLEVEFVRAGRETVLRLGDMQQGIVIENRELVDLSKPGVGSKRHIEIALPEGMTYRAGDYLAVLASNPEQSVARALRRFGIAADTRIILHARNGNVNGLPIGQPISCGELLANFVELAQPATKAQVAMLAASTRCPPEKKALEQLAGDDYDAEVLDKRKSVLDLLEEFQSCEIDLAGFLAILPPMRARQYSISSSPLWNPRNVTLTVSVVEGPALSGHGLFQGVASSYLARLQPGDRVSVAVRPSNIRFHPPADPATPMIMICAGSGIAPFRGFLQERAAQKAAGQPVGPALLFFGATYPDADYLYSDELAAWERDGVVEVLPAFSGTPEGDIIFVQHRVWAERRRIEALFREGAIVYVCGDGKHMAPAVREALLRAAQEVTGLSDTDLEKWADEQEHVRGRYVSDVFA